MKRLFEHANWLFQKTNKSPEYLAYFMSLSYILAYLEAHSLPVPEIKGSFYEYISLEWRNEKDEFILSLKPNNKIIYSGVFQSHMNICGNEITTKTQPLSPTIESMIRLFS